MDCMRVSSRRTGARRLRLALALVAVVLAGIAAGCAGGGRAAPPPSGRPGGGSTPPDNAAPRDLPANLTVPSGAHFRGSFGETGERIGQFRSPEAVAVDLQGNVFIAERLNNRVQKFDRTGQYILQFGSLGTGPAQFNYPIALYARQGLWLYVLDAQNARLVKYDLSGNLNGTVLDLNEQRIRSQVGVVRPRNFTLDRDGNIYIAERERNRVLVFNNFLDYRTTYGGSGSGEGGLLDPRGLVASDTGDFYVADSGNGRLVIFSSLGIMQHVLPLTPAGPTASPRGIARDASGMLFVADPPGNRVLAIAPNGSIAFTLGDEGVDAQLDGPADVAVDKQGRLFVTDTGHDRVVMYDLVRPR